MAEDSESLARKAGRLAGYDGQDLEGLVEHLRNQTAEKLCEIVYICLEDIKQVGSVYGTSFVYSRFRNHIFIRNIWQSAPGSCFSYPFIPSVEKIKDGAFLPDCPEKLIKSATPMPTIIGFNDQDGLLVYIR